MADPHPPSLGQSSRLEPYPEYKDSGVAWLGEIPAHWSVGRVKECAAVWLSNVDKKVVRGEPHVRLCNYTDVYYHERIDSRLDFMQATAKPEQVRRFSLRRGDVMITKDSETWTDIAVPAVVTEDLRDVLCGYHLALIRPKPDCLGAFLGAAIGAVGLRDQYRVSANGITRFGLTGDAIRNGVLPLPPLTEQRAITEFLGRETVTIEGLVAKQERLIDLLQEKRAAIIGRGVTRGLDPDVPMKDSGVEWLGEIPSHWNIARLKQVLSHNDSGVWGDEGSDNGTIILRSTEQTVDGAWAIENPAVRELSRREYAASRLVEGDLVITKSSGSARHIGKTSLVSKEIESLDCCHSNFMQRLRVRSDEMVSRYLWYVLNSPLGRGQFCFLSASTTGLANLNGTIIGMVAVVLPPLLEQRAITDFLDSEAAKIDAVTAKARQTIDALKEFRVALISAAVTGKIDVREVAA